MSGGVDSSVAACLLREQGYDVVGVFMRLGSENHVAPTDGDACRADTPRTVSLPIAKDDSNAKASKGCCSAADATDARRVAGQLNIPFYALNFERDFGKLVDYFVSEYAVGRTPNPCVRCNQWLKFGRLLEYADVVGAGMIATGHYARVSHDVDRSRLLRGVYSAKDQSYVLFGIGRETLARTLFPLGEMTKDEVRTHARRFGLALHDKPESQDICFVPDGDYARLVRSKTEQGFAAGEIRHVDGRTLGSHAGTANYTIGQRRGLGVAVGEPVYVADIDTTTNTVTVGPRDAVLSKTVRVSEVSWLRPAPTEAIRADAKIRYHHEPAAATITPARDGKVHIEFDIPQEAVTPGQAAVFYEGDEVIGGGWIEGR
ncbi:MAG: tRNA 2-thiouridine(34) synthase MnmA [Phycisphaerales bacterium]|nr:tRNA 2-thiouridine(34) synthase MnmA [Phycisphaerales bacterium]MCB9856005.1 tRNA 2-thiouridine(34) synthase MnmA [Phycisphaerales bacterium]MCB9864968.1 tRNA 2-thiouridine(34) synthase MnmA [Phycisphaerales bacterium]